MCFTSSSSCPAVPYVAGREEGKTGVCDELNGGPWRGRVRASKRQLHNHRPTTLSSTDAANTAATATASSSTSDQPQTPAFSPATTSTIPTAAAAYGPSLSNCRHHPRACVYRGQRQDLTQVH